jgi:hypothetical protein
MASQEPNLGLPTGYADGDAFSTVPPDVADGNAGGMNGALERLGAVINLSTLSSVLTAPPSNPIDGQRYIVAAGATGAWAGKDTQLAVWRLGAWVFYRPRVGWKSWDQTLHATLVWTGTSWSEDASSNNGVTVTVGATTVDSVTDLTVTGGGSLTGSDGAATLDLAGVSGATLSITGAGAPITNVTSMVITGADVSGSEGAVTLDFTDTSQSNAPLIADGAVKPRKPSTRASIIFDVCEFGALGDGTGNQSGNTIADKYPSQYDTLESMAAIVVNGATPYAYLTDPTHGYLFGRLFTGTVSAAASEGDTQLYFLDALSGTGGWSANVAQWQNPLKRYMLLKAGMGVSGAGIPNGTTLVSFNSVFGSAGYGSIVLSNELTAPIASGETITFRVSPAQFGALSLDTFGAQTAIAQACYIASGFGRKVVFGGSSFFFNDTILVPSGLIYGMFDVEGLGAYGTAFSWQTDLGVDRFGLGSPVRGPAYLRTRYANFFMAGPGGHTVGVQGAQMTGLGVGGRNTVARAAFQGFGVGFGINGDHIYIEDVSSAANYKNCYAEPWMITNGGVNMKNVELASSYWASMAIAASASFDSNIWNGLSLGFGPIGIHKELPDSSGNLTNPVNDAVTNTSGIIALESAGNCGFLNGVYGSNKFTMGGTWTVGATYDDYIDQSSGAPKPVAVFDLRSGNLFDTQFDRTQTGGYAQIRSKVVGHSTGTTYTVESGSLTVGDWLGGIGVEWGTKILSEISTGVYEMDTAQTIPEGTTCYSIIPRTGAIVAIIIGGGGGCSWRDDSTILSCNEAVAPIMLMGPYNNGENANTRFDGMSGDGIFVTASATLARGDVVYHQGSYQLGAQYGTNPPGGVAAAPGINGTTRTDYYPLAPVYKRGAAVFVKQTNSGDELVQGSALYPSGSGLVATPGTWPYIAACEIGTTARNMPIEGNYESVQGVIVNLRV